MAKTKPGRKDLELHGYISAERMAQLLDCSASTVYRRASEGRFPPLHEVPGGKRFRLDEVQAWQKAGEVWPLPTQTDGRE